MGTEPWEGKFDPENCPNCPVTWVNWEETQDFLQQVNLHFDDSRLYRLPTEAEWEYAARAGTNTAWSFGDDPVNLTDYAWYRDNTCEVNACFLHEVGLKLPSPWGLYDMHGNVAEWIADWSVGGYSKEPQIDPLNDKMPSFANTDQTPKRIVRGGPFKTSAIGVKSGFRAEEVPTARWSDIGFRIAASLSIETGVSPTRWGMIKSKVLQEFKTPDTE